jgi:hypothetical protein
LRKKNSLRIFEIDHIASFESHGIKKLKERPVLPIYKGVDGICTYLFHMVEHLLH